MWLRPTPHPTTATLQILDADTPGSLFLLFFTGKDQRWTSSYRRNPCLFSLAAQKNSEITAGAGEWRSTREEYTGRQPTSVILATIADKCNLSINYCHLGISCERDGLECILRVNRRPQSAIG